MECVKYNLDWTMKNGLWMLTLSLRTGLMAVNCELYCKTKTINCRPNKNHWIVNKTKECWLDF